MTSSTECVAAEGRGRTLTGTILVTGGMGFLGGHVVAALARAGYTVRCLVRGAAPTESGSSGAEYVHGDLLDRLSLDRALDGAAAVVHVAGFVSAAARDRSRLFAVNVAGARHLLEAAGAAGVRRAVFTSSTSAVGALHADRPDRALAEDAAFNLASLPVPYVQAKRLAHEAALAARQAGLPVVILSPTFVLGPGDVRLTSSELVDAFVRGRVPGYLAGGLNPIDVRDLAPAYVAALEHPDPAPQYILAGSENLTTHAFFKRLERASGVRAPRFRIPYRLALMAGALADRFAPGASLTSAAVRLGSLYWYFDGSAARRELGLRTRCLDETLATSVDWVRHRAACPTE